MATILIVDDDESLLELLKLHLTSHGYQVQIAKDAIEAGHRVLESPPDMIITDVMMPYMDGFEFISALKSDRTLPEIPVIFLTSVTDGNGRGKELGAVGYLTKPVRAERLAAMVAEHLPLKARQFRP
ncbi:MAG: response regulator [Betaproteobacteria bacterium]|nr:response regulator [Betaproteobacteria bacterium]